MLANITFSCINVYLIGTKIDSKAFRLEILSITKRFQATHLLSVLHENFFDLNSEKRKINKKSKFLLSGEQNQILCRMFYEYLKTIKESDASGLNSPIYESMYNLLNIMLSLSYMVENHEKSASDIIKTIDSYIDFFLYI